MKCFAWGLKTSRMERLKLEKVRRYLFKREEKELSLDKKSYEEGRKKRECVCVGSVCVETGGVPA